MHQIHCYVNRKTDRYMLHLPVPKANYHNIALKPSEHQKKMVEGLSERAEKVRNSLFLFSLKADIVILSRGMPS